MQQGANWQPESSEEADGNKGFQVILQSGAAFVCACTGHSTATLSGTTTLNCGWTMLPLKFVC